MPTDMSAIWVTLPPMPTAWLT
ncbi:unnamed protein product [Oppiella nova]|uniref:Uncharacterized protein n=1 Tax=Oppiella nova TaxID=334625 RepID=A0A7R9R2A1_9ACAR|nr:unnamed protein product [Oppiella nova]CAG2184234.1 unnamed protein product [Oppiella nova]